jgi:hypothetical protein
MSSTRTTTAAGALAAMLAAGPSVADIVNTPGCQRDLATANGLINGIAAREKLFVPNDLAKNCGLLKQNLADMLKAREPLDRCVTGHDHGENLAQIDDSMGDIRAVLADKCRK